MLLFVCTTVWAEEDLTVKTHRDLMVKMPYLTLQPALNYCREEQPVLKPELEQAYLDARSKFAKATQPIINEGLHSLSENELDAPIDAKMQQELEAMFTVIDQGVRQMDAQQYCPFLIQKLKSFDEDELRKQVESSYTRYKERAQQAQ